MPDLEVLLVDDGSTDETVEYLRSAYAAEERLKLIQVENGERGRARNIGYEAAKGEYIIFLDSDDLLLPEALSIFRKATIEEPKASLIAGKFILNDGMNKTKGPLSKYKAGYYDRSILLKGNPLACNIVIKRNTKGFAKFREERIYSSMEDWIFMLENTSHHDLLILDDYTVSMTDHDQRSMRGNQEQVINARMASTELLVKEMDFTEPEIRTLKAYSHYFCGIHAYLGSMRTVCYTHVIQSLQNGGPFKELIVLAVKVTLGRKLIRFLNRS